MTKNVASKTTEEIAQDLGETEERVRRTIARVVLVLGPQTSLGFVGRSPYD